jgi:Ulp1 family protease
VEYKIEENMCAVPQQEGGYDCGVFASMFADFQSLHIPVDFSQDDIQFFREKILLTILAS